VLSAWAKARTGNDQAIATAASAKESFPVGQLAAAI
jgi:hypothetical protein